VRLVGAGVTGLCSLFSTRLGGINAGVCFNTDTFGVGDGRLSKIGCNAAEISRRVIL